MKINDIFKLAIETGIEADFRSKEKIQKVLDTKKQDFEHSSDQECFDKELLENPYSDSRILHIADDIDIKKILFGIDIDPSEILMAKQLGIDLVISHHPLGIALATLHDVMEMQADVLNQYGVPINIAEGLLKKKISEVARGLNKANHQRTVDAAKIMGVNLMCLHTVCDNLAADYLKEAIESQNPETVGDVMDVIEGIEEYKVAKKNGAGAKIFVGNKNNKCGVVAMTEITGGTEGSPKIYDKMANAGIGTVVGMHVSEDHRKEAEAAHVNMVVAGHMSSDSLGINLFLDKLKDIEIIPCSGLIRVKRG
jgi:putative NIF3 family GTP cyclohydrolase 1 type 2